MVRVCIYLGRGGFVEIGPISKMPRFVWGETKALFCQRTYMIPLHLLNFMCYFDVCVLYVYSLRTFLPNTTIFESWFVALGLFFFLFGFAFFEGLFSPSSSDFSFD